MLPEGYAVLDTPGMRELQLTDAAEGIAEVFADLSDLSARCRFSDCRHEDEPGCAVQAGASTEAETAFDEHGGAVPALAGYDAGLRRWRSTTTR